MKRVAFFSFFRFTLVPFTVVLFALMATAGRAAAQPTSGQITISTHPDGAYFYVDGQLYNHAATFLWPAGSKHTLQFRVDPPPPGQPSAAIQTSPGGDTQYTFNGWVDNAGLLAPVSDPTQVITADPRVTSITAQLGLLYRVTLNFFSSPGSQAAPACGAPGFIPPAEFRVGLVYLGGQCYWASASVFAAAGVLNLNAIPYPGFVFLGWSVNLGPTDSYLRTLNITGPVTIAPRFSPAKRVRFVTSPPGLQVLIDRSPAPTRSTGDATGSCPNNEQLSPAPPAGILPLCFGDFDFAPGSTHLIGGVSPQIDKPGKTWVFDSWSNGGGQNASYTADTITASADTLIARFIHAAQVSFVTTPPGLKLSVDGRQNWPAYNFIWGLGSTHQVMAAPEQFDSKGRKYTFRNWSNAGSGGQTVTVDQAAVDSGLRLIASYDVLSRVVVQTSPPGLAVQVDGASCATPCTVDRPNGAAVRVGAPTSLPAGDAARLDFAGWSDGSNTDHVVTLNSDFSTLTANYTPSYRLAAASDPSGGVAFRFDPASNDSFYPANTQVQIAVDARAGFKFRRWDGDLSGTYSTGYLSMTTPRSVVARLDRVPFIAPAGVRNAAGGTPDPAVAPGSVISIFGESLAPRVEVGRVNPLAQTIAGVTVTVADRILPLIYVSPEQINAQVPSDLPDGDYSLVVHLDGMPDVAGAFTVARDAPGVFSQTVDGQQFVAALHADGSLVTRDSPARNGETISILGTGFGPYRAPVVDGFLPPDPPPLLIDSVELSIGDVPVAPLWSGAAAVCTGCAMTKFQISSGLPLSSSPELKVRVNGKLSNTVLLPIE